MKFLHVNNANAYELNKHIKKGCGPCNSTKPEWAKIENVFPPFLIENAHLNHFYTFLHGLHFIND